MPFKKKWASANSEMGGKQRTGFRFFRPPALEFICCIPILKGWWIIGKASISRKERKAW